MLECACLVIYHLTASLFYTTPAADDVQRPAPIRTPFPICISNPSSDDTLDNTAAPVRDPFPFVHKPNTLEGDLIVVPAGCGLGRLGQDRGVARRLAKAWGEAWERSLSSDDGIDSDSDFGA